MTFLRDSEQLLLGLGADDLLLSDGESLLQGVGSGDKNLSEKYNDKRKHTTKADNIITQDDLDKTSDN